MTGNNRDDCSETRNSNATELSVKEYIVKLIEDLERDIKRIEDKIATVCGGYGKSEAEKGHFLEDNIVSVKTEVDGEAEITVSPTNVETTVRASKIVRRETEKDGFSHFLEPTRQCTTDQQSEAESDDDDWAAFISERAVIPVKESNIDLTVPEAMADCTSNTDDGWDDFFRERAAMAVVDSEATEDDFDEFFNDRITLDKYKHAKSGKLRKLIRRIFGRH